MTGVAAFIAYPLFATEEEIAHYADYLELIAPMNALYITFCLMVRHHYAKLARNTANIALNATCSLHTADHSNNTNLLEAVNALADCAQEQAKLRADLFHQLDAARAILSACNANHANLLQCASSEISDQYQTVLGYANYLDERIAAGGAQDDLRYDFDDVCESGFNLKLIAGAMDMLRADQPLNIQSVSLPNIMQQTMLALSSSLDRRAMKLTTSEVDLSVVARTDAAIITHVLWMMLLGLIRYAANESTLRMRCLNDHEGHAIMSIVVSELAPNAMTSEERYAHLLRQNSHESPHMFASTIRQHANILLAQMLLQKLNVEIEVIPLSSYACELCFKLPL